MKYYPWIITLRLKTLPLALSAILVGNALAYWQQKFNLTILLLSLITASLLQILSNIANDYGDAINGSDSADRIGPTRAIQLGMITLKQLKKALWINVLLCVIFGIGLLIIACNNINELLGFLLLGLISIIAAITYTVGKHPYGYIGFGDLSVLVFFGLVSVIGSYYLQTKSLPVFLILPAVGCGLLSVAVLNINNLRDLESDRKHNKQTLAVLMGKKVGCFYHLLLLLLSLSFLCIFSLWYLKTIWGYLFLLTLPLFFLHCRAVLQFHSAKDAAPLLLQMIGLTLMTNLFYCLGIILS